VVKPVRFLGSPNPNNQPKIADPLVAHYDELNALWKQAEEELAAMRVPVPVEVMVEPGASEDGRLERTEYLSWSKMEKDWRLCFLVKFLDRTDGVTMEWKPVAECPMEKRIELAAHYGKLKAKMNEAREKYIPHVGAAIASLKQALAD
jgi:hypothetical protein